MTRVKVCGIADLDDARLAVELGAWAVGMVFHPESPRACDPGTAERIGAELRRRAEIAGVFVNWPLDELEHMADRASLTMLQLHGDEGPAYCREAARRTGAKVMKAVQAKDATTVRKLVSYREVDLHMLDTHSDHVRGGTGVTFQWELTSYHRSPVPLVLSGGLDPGNVGEAIERVRPYAVDSASGTEAEPGRKDPDKLRALFEAVERADDRRAA
ncbi:MAG: phosphoribosylanthranilate isomerase [Thermoleophilaceae bacterium]|jgi:phosphoribosylanthranilate isomerase|nr:phosphoribosylanthranilate isomerase [Thermoleophilaceae bacterium]